MAIKEEIESLVEPLLSEDQFLVDVRLKGGDPPNKLQVIVDGDHGLDIDTCASISRQLSATLDESDYISGKYTLEVTTPGLDFPLETLRQYKKNIGKNLRINLTDEKTIEGVLLDATQEKIVIEKIIKSKGKKARKETEEIDFSQIAKTIVLPSFK